MKYAPLVDQAISSRLISTDEYAARAPRRRLHLEAAPQRAKNKKEYRRRKFSKRSSNMSCSMVSRSLSILTEVAAHICTTPSLTSGSSISTDFSARCRSGLIIRTSMIRQCSAIFFARGESQNRQLGCLFGGLRGVCRNLRARSRFAAAGALSFHRGRRAGSREHV